MKIKPIFLGLLTLLCLIVTVALWFAVNGSNPELTEVKAKVISSKEVVTRYNNSRITKYKVELEYEGETYELINAHNAYSYAPGKEVTVFLSNGKLYADEAGVKSSSPLGIAYFVFLFGTIIMLAVWLTYRSKYKAKLKEETAQKAV